MRGVLPSLSWMLQACGYAMISSFIVSRDVQLPAATCSAVLPRQSVANKAEG